MITAHEFADAVKLMRGAQKAHRRKPYNHRIEAAKKYCEARVDKMLQQIRRPQPPPNPSLN